jgi:hypothetical protein
MPDLVPVIRVLCNGNRGIRHPVSDWDMDWEVGAWRDSQRACR